MKWQQNEMIQNENVLNKIKQIEMKWHVMKWHTNKFFIMKCDRRVLSDRLKPKSC